MSLLLTPSLTYFEKQITQVQLK